MEAAETMETQPNRYHDAPCDVMITQGYVMKNYMRAKDYVAATNEEVAKAWAVSAALKHLLRLGLKDDVDCELLKIENYAHYARTGEWMPKDSK